MAALLIDLKAGDEVIMPSYTFSSTANAVVLRGAVPVFIDSREDTLNMDERLIEAAITPRTVAIYCVHYGGVPCEMDTICEIAKRRNIYVVEDNAQGTTTTYI
jgi:dTDP-4-amino-4,6-dideoxygalactose transaminase